MQAKYGLKVFLLLFALCVHDVARGQQPRAGVSKTGQEVLSIPRWEPDDIRLLGYANRAELRVFSLEVMPAGRFDFYGEPGTVWCDCEPRLEFVRFESYTRPVEGSYTVWYDPRGLPLRIVFDSGGKLELFWEDATHASVVASTLTGEEYVFEIASDSLFEDPNPSEANVDVGPDPACECDSGRGSGLQATVAVTTGGKPERFAERVDFELNINGDVHQSDGAQISDGIYVASFPVSPLYLTAEQWESFACNVVGYMVDQTIPLELRGGSPEEVFGWVLEEMIGQLDDLGEAIQGDERASLRLLRRNIVRYAFSVGLAIAWNQLEDEIPPCESLDWDPAIDFITDRLEEPGLLSVSVQRRYGGGSLLILSDTTSFNPAVGPARVLAVDFPADEPGAICPEFGLARAFPRFWWGPDGGYHQTQIEYDCTFIGSRVTRREIWDFTFLPGGQCFESSSESLGTLPDIPPGQRYGQWLSPVSFFSGVCAQATRGLSTYVCEIESEGASWRFAEPGYCSTCR